MSYQIGQFIDGASLINSQNPQRAITNPADGSTIGHCVFANADDVERAIASAEQAFVEWSQTPPLRRARVLFRFKALLEAHSQELAHLVTQEHGKTLEDAQGSVMRGIELVEFACGIPQLLKGDYSENVSTDVDTYTVRQPLGVCAGVSPFNFPVMVPIWMFVNACAAGNTFILKPSEQDPAAPHRLAELFIEAGAPAGVFNVIQGDKTVVDQLIAHPAIKAMTAVASTPVAEAIYQAATANGKRAHTFGGAKNHCVVMPDADIQQTANALMGAAYGSAGERCMAISVAVVVGNSTADALVGELKQRVPELRIGPGTAPNIEMGPLISAAHRQNVIAAIDAGVSEGAELLVDGRSTTVAGHEDGFFLGGSLFDKVTADMSVYQREIFGPVLCVVRVNTFAEALAFVNNNPYGNGTAIFTQDGSIAHQYCQQVQVGLVGVNVPIPVPVAYHPFGGWKRSVFGDINMHGEQSVQFYTKLKTVTTRWPKTTTSDPAFAMPTHQ